MKFRTIKSVLKVAMAITFGIGVGRLPISWAQGFNAKPEQTSPSSAKSKSSKDRSAKDKKDKKKSKAKDSQSIDSRLPDWVPPKFDYFLVPITGFQTRSNSKDGADTVSTYSELGLGLGLSHIPVPAGNPGVTISPEVSFTQGHIASATKTKDQKSSDSSTSFQRNSGGIDFNFFNRWFRYRIGIHGGVLDYDKEDRSSGQRDTRNLHIVNEPSVLLAPGWEALLTIDYGTLWYESYSDPELRTGDLFLHTRKTLSFLSTRIDVGPGVTIVQLKNPSDPNDGTFIGGQTTYVSGLVGAHLFWKIVSQLKLKYIVSASKNIDDSFASVLLPDQEISNPEVLGSMPADSFEQTAFIGANNLFFGLGGGWRYHRVIYNFAANDSSRREINDQGWSITFSLF